MTPFDALAAAIRERLTAGRPAPLPGLGTLVRQHVSARVEERADGTRVLLPPGETIGLAPTDGSHESLAPAFGRLLALPDRDVPRAYADAADQLEARLAATGEVRLPGVGLLRRTSGGVILGVEAELLAAVNRVYEGLSPVGPSRTDDEAPGAAAPPSSPVARAPAPEPEPTPQDAGPDAAGSATPDLESPDNDPFMIGLPPVGSPPPEDADVEPLAAPLAPEPADEEPPAPDVPPGPAADALPDLPEAGVPETHTSDEATPEPADADNGFHLPVQADASEFGFAPAPADASEFFTGPASEPPPDDDAPEAEHAGAPGAEEPDDEPLPAPFDPGDLSTEPLMASDLMPPAAEPAEPDEPHAEVTDAPPTPTRGDLDEADADVAEGAFIDDDTLDDDLDDVLAVPFGRPDAEPIAEVLPPSTPDPTDLEAEDDDDWMAETWTAAGAGPPPVGLGDGDAVEIEDAELIDDEEPDAPFAPESADDDDDGRLDRATVTDGATPEAPVDDVAPPHSPDEEFEALLAAPAAEPPPEPPPVIVPEAPSAPPEPETSVEARHRSPWGWVVALVAVAAIVVAAVWLWPRLTAREAAPEIVETPVPAAVPAELPPAPTEEPADSLAALSPADASPVEAADPAGAPEPSANVPAAPAPSGRAFAPPRLDGLDDGDRRTLVGPPIDPSMGGWTLVVASLRSEEAAADLAGRYRAAGYRTAVFPPSGRTVTRYRIGVGQFGSRDQARRLLDRVFEYEPGGTWPLNLRTL